MLQCFYPDSYQDSAYSIDYEKLRMQGYEAIIYDIDNTLVCHGAPADERSMALIERLKGLGFSIMLLSNNKEPRVKSFNDQVHVSYIYKAGKPNPKNYEAAMVRMGSNRKNTVFIGDQIFTDIWGAKKAGIYSILVKPIDKKEEIQNTLAQMRGDDLVYVPLRVEAEQVGKAVEGAYALSLTGLNVTVPHKSAVIPYLVDIDPLAEKIGAVNTLVRQEGGFKGYNTDMPGLLRAMRSEGITVKEQSVLLLGAGGAARAVAFLCMSEGAKEILLYNRTVEKAERVAKEAETAFGRSCIRVISKEELLQLTGSYLAIQCTSVGLYPNVDDVIVQEDALYEKIHTGVDLIYRPYETMFMKKVKAHGGKTMNGLKMLLYQGIIAYELWNKCEVSEETAAHILQKMKEEMGIHE